MGFDFNTFIFFLQENRVDEIKSLITPLNAKAQTPTCEGITTQLCRYGADEPELLRHFIMCGAPMEPDDTMMGLLHICALHAKPLLLREIINIRGGASIDDLESKDRFGRDVYDLALLFFNDEDKPFEERVACIKELIEVNGKVPPKWKSCKWVNEFAAARVATRSAAIAILGLIRCSSATLQRTQNGKDVLILIARCIWGTRGHC